MSKAFPLPGVFIHVQDNAETIDGKSHIITRIENPIDTTCSLIYLDGRHDRKDAYCVERIGLDRYDVDSVAKYFLRVENCFICTTKIDKYKWGLIDARNKIGNAIQAVDNTIYSHLDSDNENITVEFLRTLYARAKGLREAEGIITKMLDGLSEEDNSAAQEK